MTRYIDADNLVEKLSAEEDEFRASHSEDGRMDDPFADGVLSTVFTMYQFIKKEHTADVHPVVHAHWIEEYFEEELGGVFKIYKCSNCKEVSIDEPNTEKYCHHCGARMDDGRKR